VKTAFGGGLPPGLPVRFLSAHCKRDKEAFVFFPMMPLPIFRRHYKIFLSKKSAKKPGAAKSARENREPSENQIKEARHPFFAL